MVKGHIPWMGGGMPTTLPKWGKKEKTQKSAGTERVTRGQEFVQMGVKSKTICKDSDGKCGIASVGALILRFQQRQGSEVITFHKKILVW